MSRLASTWRDNLVCLLFSYMYLTELGFLASPRRRISFSFSSDSAFTPRRNLLHRHSDHCVQITEELPVICEITPAARKYPGQRGSVASAGSHLNLKNSIQGLSVPVGPCPLQAPQAPVRALSGKTTLGAQQRGSDSFLFMSLYLGTVGEYTGK